MGTSRDILEERICDLEHILKNISHHVKDEIDGKYVFGRYVIYGDGVIYDTEEAKDIPIWVFMLRDFILKENK